MDVSERVAAPFAGIVGPAAFISSWLVAGALRRGYDPIDQAISELAALDTPNRLIVTSGMVIFGLGSQFFASELRRRGQKRVGLAMTLAGLSSLGVAAFPCSEGCPGAGTSFTDTGHAVAAGLHYATFTAAPLLLSFDESARGGHRTFSALAAIVAGLALSAQVLGIGPNGLMQRIGLTTNDVWMIVTALTSANSMPRPPR